MTVSVLTLVRNRADHLRQLVEGLKRSHWAPDELVVVEMGGEPVGPLGAGFPVRVERMEADRLPLAAARNRAARLAGGEALVFLDVDCVPMARCLGRLAAELDRRGGLLCADVRYLGPGEARDGWTEAGLLARGHAHPARCFPKDGVREEPDPGLFWSLAFAVRRGDFDALGGFDAGYEGYGAEDTDFGFRAAALGLPLRFVGGAVVCHQHHDSCDPPLQHLDDIVRNARRFHARWGRWPMEGWLSAFADLGLVDWREDALAPIRAPTREELDAARRKGSAWLELDPAGDRIAAPPVPLA